MKIINKSISVILVILIFTALNACQTAQLRSGRLQQPDTPAEGDIALLKQAEGMPNEVAWITATVFAIPIAPMTRKIIDRARLTEAGNFVFQFLDALLCERHASERKKRKVTPPSFPTMDVSVISLSSRTIM